MIKVKFKTRFILRQNLLIAVSLFLCTCFSYHSIAGERSYYKLSQLKETQLQQQLVLTQLQDEKNSIESKVKMMRAGSLSVDLVEEQARYILGYAKDNEITLVSN